MEIAITAKVGAKVSLTVAPAQDPADFILHIDGAVSSLAIGLSQGQVQALVNQATDVHGFTPAQIIPF